MPILVELVPADVSDSSCSESESETESIASAPKKACVASTKKTHTVADVSDSSCSDSESETEPGGRA